MRRQPSSYVVLLLAAGCGGAAGAVVETGGPALGIVWKARMFSEIPGEKHSVDGSPVTLTLLPAGIQCEIEKGRDFDIPFSSVGEISHDVTKRNRGSIVLQYFLEHLNAYTCSHDCTVAIMLVPVFAPFTRQKHYVALSWNEDSKMKRLVFRLGKRDYQAFVDGVSAASGQPWWNVVGEREKQRRELRQQLKGAFTVRLKHEAVLGENLLKRGAYKILFVDRDAGEGEVFFFASYELVLTAPVDVVGDGSVVSAEAVYGQLPDGKWSVTEIRIPGKILHFRNADPNAPGELADDTPAGREP